MRIQSIIFCLSLFWTITAHAQSVTIRSTDAAAFPTIRVTLNVPANVQPKAATFKVLEDRKELEFDLHAPTADAGYVLEFETANPPRSGNVYQYEIRYQKERLAGTYVVPSEVASSGSGWGTFLMVVLVGIGSFFLFRWARTQKAAFDQAKRERRDAQSQEFQERYIREVHEPRRHRTAEENWAATEKKILDTIVAEEDRVPRKPMLMVTMGNRTQFYPVDKETVAVGRSPENDIVIAEPTVSGKHLTVIRENDTYYVTDVGSTNGTFVNGTRIRGKYAVTPGDAIHLGAVRAVFHL